jgi:peptidoglycan hydrolase-like protein with peptidoglycan-binding domain
MTHNRSMHDAPDPWRASLRASRERRAAERRARRWTFRRRGVAACAAAVMALGTGAAVAGNGGTGTSQSDASASSVTLKPGSRGANVKRLQRKLRVQASGYYGSLTKKAVKRFQKRAGLKPDGVAGPDTLAKLRVRVTPEQSQDDTGTDTGSGSGVDVPAKLQRIAQCESGGNPRAVSPDGTYRGKYQFDQATWEAMGGTGDPAEAPESVQDRLAVKLYKQRGSAPWGRCADA